MSNANRFMHENKIVKKDCGRTRAGGGQRIVGGTEVEHHSLPHMALLQVKQHEYLVSICK